MKQWGSPLDDTNGLFIGTIKRPMTELQSSFSEYPWHESANVPLPYERIGTATCTREPLGGLPFTPAACLIYIPVWYSSHMLYTSYTCYQVYRVGVPCTGTTSQLRLASVSQRNSQKRISASYGIVVSGRTLVWTWPIDFEKIHARYVILHAWI
jgi:hypothetical protein